MTTIDSTWRALLHGLSGTRNQEETSNLTHTHTHTHNNLHWPTVCLLAESLGRQGTLTAIGSVCIVTLKGCRASGRRQTSQSDSGRGREREREGERERERESTSERGYSRYTGACSSGRRCPWSLGRRSEKSRDRTGQLWSEAWDLPRAGTTQTCPGTPAARSGPL